MTLVTGVFDFKSVCASTSKSNTMSYGCLQQEKAWLIRSAGPSILGTPCSPLFN